MEKNNIDMKRIGQVDDEDNSHDVVLAKLNVICAEYNLELNEFPDDYRKGFADGQKDAIEAGDCKHSSKSYKKGFADGQAILTE